MINVGDYLYEFVIQRYEDISVSNNKFANILRFDIPE